MIDKVGAIIIRDKKMLVARSKSKTWFFIPGGTRENGESDEECLRREIMEELATEIEILGFYGEFITEATGKPDKIKLRAYFCRPLTEPKASSEIAELAWADSSFDPERLGNVLKLVLFPKLREDGYIS